MRVVMCAGMVVGQLLAAASAFAAGGTATLSHWWALNANIPAPANTGTTGIYVSNISSGTVHVTLQLFASNGLKIGDTGFPATVTISGAFTKLIARGRRAIWRRARPHP